MIAQLPGAEPGLDETDPSVTRDLHEVADAAPPDQGGVNADRC